MENAIEFSDVLLLAAGIALGCLALAVGVAYWAFKQNSRSQNYCCKCGCHKQSAKAETQPGHEHSKNF